MRRTFRFTYAGSTDEPITDDTHWLDGCRTVRTFRIRRRYVTLLGFTCDAYRA
jgi:hypothetical protein